MLRQFDPLVQDFDIGSSSGSRPTIYVLHERLGYVPLTVFGDGMRRALALVVAAASAQDGILLLDEFEAGIHFSVLQKVLPVLFRACQHFNVEVSPQLTVLRQSTRVLRIEGASLDDVAAFRLPSRTTDSVVTRYSGETSMSFATRAEWRCGSYEQHLHVVEGQHDVEFVCGLLEPEGFQKEVMVERLDDIFGRHIINTNFPHEGPAQARPQSDVLAPKG